MNLTINLEEAFYKDNYLKKGISKFDNVKHVKLELTELSQIESEIELLLWLESGIKQLITFSSLEKETASKVLNVLRSYIFDKPESWKEEYGNITNRIVSIVNVLDKDISLEINYLTENNTSYQQETACIKRNSFTISNRICDHGDVKEKELAYGPARLDCDHGSACLVKIELRDENNTISVDTTKSSTRMSYLNLNNVPVMCFNERHKITLKELFNNSMVRLDEKYLNHTCDVEIRLDFYVLNNHVDTFQLINTGIKDDTGKFLKPLDKPNIGIYHLVEAKLKEYCLASYMLRGFNYAADKWNQESVYEISHNLKFL